MPKTNNIDTEIQNLLTLIQNITIEEHEHTMATEEQLKTITSYLKLPDCIRDLPVFKGHKTSLHDFISNVDEIISTCEQVLGRKQIPTSYLRAIRNKIQHEADEILSMYGTKLDWPVIKSNLINHYSDKRNETSLIKDLHSLYQGSNSIEHFFSKIIEIQSALITHVKLHDAEVVQTAKETLFTKMCLNAFLAGIREPLGSMIRARNPPTLADAYNLCVVEQNMFYIKNKPQPLSNNIPHHQQNIRRPIPSIPIPSRGYQLNPQIFQNQLRNTQHFKNSQYYNHQPFKPAYTNPPPQPFRHSFQKPPAILPPRSRNGVEPMDTSSNKDQYRQYTVGLSKPPIPNRYQQSGPPRFQKQLYNIQEVEDPYLLEDYSNLDGMNEYIEEYDDPTSLSYNYEPQPIDVPLPEDIDDQDFQEPASKPRSDS